MKRKKIGVFIGGVTQDYSSRICHAISRKAEAMGADVYYFSTFNSYDDNLLYLEGERKIFALPEYTKLDGIIVARDTLYLQGSEKIIIDHCKRAGCPTVALRAPLIGCYNVMINEEVSLEKMICHFIEEHKFTDICFMAGRQDLEDGRLRLKCFRRVMEEHGLAVTEDMIYYGDYWKTQAAQAADHFLKHNGGKCPQAIVCANDYMAVTLVGELEARGFKVPQDVCVSGFDDVPESGQTNPPLTTISVPFEKMAERAMDTLAAIFRGEMPENRQYVDVEERYRGSCGCNRHKLNHDWYALVREVEDKRTTIYNTTFMNADLEGVTDETTLFTNAHKYDCGVNTNKTWVCLCDETEEMSEEDRNVGLRRECTKRMILRSVKTADGEVHLMNKPFERKELLPEEERKELKSGSFFFVLLHYKNHVLGYVVTNYANYDHYNDLMQPWAMSLSLAIEHYRLNTHLNAMADIERMYKEDALTGIYNRRGFEEKARNIFREASVNKKKIAVISVDMDNLKKINDAFGHAAGDEALCRVAKAMTAVATEDMVYARTGGDEFNVVVKIRRNGDAKRYVTALRDVLTKINRDSLQNFKAEVSCGYVELDNVAATGLLDALQKSDELMYADKRMRKAERKD